MSASLRREPHGCYELLSEQPSALFQFDFRVAELVKRFGLPHYMAESLDDLRYTRTLTPNWNKALAFPASLR